MKVLKFGGTSVGSVSSILSLQKIVEKEAKHQPIIVVVSALGGITDQLIATSQLALEGDESWKTEFDSIVARHHKMMMRLLPIHMTVRCCSTKWIVFLNNFILFITVYS